MICSKEEMVQRVKDCGQTLIENAENIVSEFKYNVDLTITCYINTEDRDATPRITIETSLIPEAFIKRIQEEWENYYGG